MHGDDFQFLIRPLAFTSPTHPSPLVTPPLCLFHFVTHSTCLLAILLKVSRIIQQATTTSSSTSTRLQELLVFYMYKWSVGERGWSYRWSSAQFNLKLSNVVVESPLVASTWKLRELPLQPIKRMKRNAPLPAWSEEEDLVRCQGRGSGRGGGSQVASASLHRLKIVCDASRRRRH